MIFTSALSLAFAALAAASPIRNHRRQSCGQPPALPPALPVNGGARELPPPPPGTSLQHILIGHGIQNYTCASVGATPKPTGALAVLYDVTPLFPGQSNSSLTIDAFDALTATALNTIDIPINVDRATPFPDPADLLLDGLDPIPYAGVHMFNSAGTPLFVVDAVDSPITFLGTKLDGITAPTSADPGPDGTGAVDWLQLGAAAGADGATMVYRVVTAGGVSHGCTEAIDDSTSYATQYWFYA